MMKNLHLLQAPRRISANTRRAYRYHHNDFLSWLASVDSADQSEDQLVSLYLMKICDAGKSKSTINLAYSGIVYFLNPQRRLNESLRLLRIVNSTQKRPKKTRPVLDDELIAMLDACPDTVSGIRERALLAIGWCAALRRSELVNLAINDVALCPQGVQVTIRKSKTDQDGAGAIIPIQRASGVGSRACEALQEWLDVLKQSGIEDGPLFRGVDRHGNMKPSALTSQSVKLIIVKAAKSAGIDPAGFSGHSLRAGLATSAAMRGVPAYAIMETLRHTTLRGALEYVNYVSTWNKGVLHRLDRSQAETLKGNQNES